MHSLNQGQFNILPSILQISQISEMRAADLVHPPLASVFTIYPLLYGFTYWYGYGHSVSIAPECVSKFNELKLNKKIKYILYKLSDDYKEIVVEEASEDGDWDNFREKLINAQSKSKTVCPDEVMNWRTGVDVQ